MWKEGTTEDMLRDLDGFRTLEAKILSVISNVLEGDFKEREGHENRLAHGN